MPTDHESEGIMGYYSRLVHIEIKKVALIAEICLDARELTAGWTNDIML